MPQSESQHTPSRGPTIEIDVDPETGVWSTDGQPMIYLPRHFFINHHAAIEAALGKKAYSDLLYAAGHRSAWEWCAKEAATHGLRGVDVFRHYMKRISQRGWGQFQIEAVDERSGAARVGLRNSIYVLGQAPSRDGKLCYAFAGWFPGALEWAGQDLGLNWQLEAREVQCCGDQKHDHCLFEIGPR